jgi:hypothetical protein
MDDDREREPFPTEDPRDKGMGDQLPEQNPEGQGAGGGERQGPESGARQREAPDNDAERDSGPETATGNPDAAG